MEKRIDELRTRTLKNRNKLSEIQAYLKKVKKRCEEMIEQLGKKNMDLLWKIDEDKDLIRKLEKLPKYLLVKRKRSKYIPKLKSIKEDSGKSKRKSRSRGKRKSRSRGKRKSRSRRKSYDGSASWDSMLRKFMHENGFEFVRKTGGHYIWEDKNGIRITASSSPKKSQYKNILREIGRDIKRERDAL